MEVVFLIFMIIAVIILGISVLEAWDSRLWGTLAFRLVMFLWFSYILSQTYTTGSLWGSGF